jgi:uncharacterized membrane protein
MPPNEFCQQHIEFATHLAEIRTSLVNIEKCVTESINFKRGIVGSIVGVFLTLIVQIVAFSFLYGKLVNQVEVNTVRLGVIEAQHRGDK